MDITNIKLGSKYTDKQRMMAALAQENFCLEEVLDNCNPRLLAELDRMALSSIDAKVKSGSSLSFKEAFSGMALVVAATNNPVRREIFPEMSFPEAVAKGVGFLELMATKEALRGLSPEEIAGMAAAGTLDLVFRAPIPEVVETCGMGGDRGWGTKEVKTISASTLSALVLASLEIPAFKHGSYGNTTRVGSTDVPINFGAQICHHQADKILDLFGRTKFWFTDAHSVKTIHYLSHLLMVETVNHIVGPMTVPVAKETKLFKTVGVNHHVNPEAIAKAYTILHQRGFVNLGGVVVVCGLDMLPRSEEYQNPEWVAEHCFLDEISPVATLVSLAKGEDFIGNFVLTHEDFDAPSVPETALKVRNTIKDLMAADQAAITGEDDHLSQYLVRNAALVLLTFRGLDQKEPFAELPACYRLCLDAVNSGKSFQTLKHYVERSGGEFQNWL